MRAWRREAYLRRGTDGGMRRRRGPTLVGNQLRDGWVNWSYCCTNIHRSIPEGRAPWCSSRIRSIAVWFLSVGGDTGMGGVGGPNGGDSGFLWGRAGAGAGLSLHQRRGGMKQERRHKDTPRRCTKQGQQHDEQFAPLPGYMNMSVSDVDQLPPVLSHAMPSLPEPIAVVSKDRIAVATPILRFCAKRSVWAAQSQQLEKLPILAASLGRRRNGHQWHGSRHWP